MNERTEEEAGAASDGSSALSLNATIEEINDRLARAYAGALAAALLCGVGAALVVAGLEFANVFLVGAAGVTACVVSLAGLRLSLVAPHTTRAADALLDVARVRSRRPSLLVDDVRRDNLDLRFVERVAVTADRRYALDGPPPPSPQATS